MPHTFVLRVKRDNACQQLAQSLAPGKCPVSATSCFGVIVFIIRKSPLSSSCQLSLNISPVLRMSRASYSIRLSVSLMAFVDLCLFMHSYLFLKNQNSLPLIKPIMSLQVFNHISVSYEQSNSKHLFFSSLQSPAT